MKRRSRFEIAHFSCADNDQEIFESVIHSESGYFVHCIHDMYFLWSPLRKGH